MSRGEKHTKRKALSEEEKRQLRERSNKCISRYCNYAALVIILVALASYVAAGIANADLNRVGWTASWYPSRCLP